MHNVTNKLYGHVGQSQPGDTYMCVVGNLPARIVETGINMGRQMGIITCCIETDPSYCDNNKQCIQSISVLVITRRLTWHWKI